MTERQINDLLIDLKFTDDENDAFMDIIEYAKECQKSNNMDNLKPFISQQIDKITRDEN